MSITGKGRKTGYGLSENEGPFFCVDIASKSQPLLPETEADLVCKRQRDLWPPRYPGDRLLFKRVANFDGLIDKLGRR